LDFVQGEKDDPAHERVLLNGLKDKSVMVKVTAIRICRMYYAKTSVALMRPLLSDPSVMIRGEACQTLVASQDPAALEAARSLITDKDPQVRAALALACRYTATKQADEILETLYRDPSPEVRLQVIRSIMGKKRVPHLMTQALKDENSTIAVLALSNFLQQKGSNASESFFEILKRADNEAKHSLCGMVNYLDEPAQSQAIELLYNDKAERVRQVLVGMAGGFSEENFWKLTALAIVDKAPSVREALCGALTTKGPSPRKQALLERLLNDSDERVSARARFAMRG
jgi:HEAT repeat protein